MIATEPELAEELSMLAEVQQSSWKRIQRQFDQSLCLVNYLKSAKIWAPTLN